MTDINAIIIIGRLTNEPKLETVGSYSKCSFSIANNRSIKKGEEWQNDASFFDVVVWGSYADRVSGKYVKGDQVAIAGRLKQDRWEKDGQKFSRVYIIAESIQPCSSSGTRGETTNTTPANVTAVASAFDGTIEAENKPFDLF